MSLFLPIINDEIMAFSWRALAISPSERTKFHILNALLCCASGHPNMVNVKLFCELYEGVQENRDTNPLIFNLNNRKR
jgi:hypothetical protein